MARGDGIHRTSARNMRMTTDQVTNAQTHNEREKTSYVNQDIIPDRTPLNVHFKTPTAGYAEMFEQMRSDGVISTRGLKADAEKFGELIFDVNSAYFFNHGGYDFAKQFYADAYKAAIKIVGGEQYILSAVMHADERNRAMSDALGQDVYHYHLHVVYIPVVSYYLGLGANHSDVLDWFPKFGISMDELRDDIAKAMDRVTIPSEEETPVTPVQPEPKPTTPTMPVDGTVKTGSLVSINPGAKYYSGKDIPSWVAKRNWYVYHAKEGNDRIVLDRSEDGKYKIMSPINRADVTVVGAETPSKPTTPTTPAETVGYKVKVLCDALNIRKGPGTNYGIAGVITDRGIYTIVETSGTWGKLKSGAGWISLGWCSKV